MSLVESEDVPEITDANDYYPFGMNHLKTGNAFFGGSYKDYKYNGKEPRCAKSSDFELINKKRLSHL
ncbi:hypothetical protein [Chryseobacterium sp. CFS15]|uniref:hypothetical protein n=1 Tax=Chryseobacterium sp. CFS15 TaxID=2986946 RepID=UPI00280885DB|nr:hypothetical protein [Chryseobacterium sp. CFS15]MDQ8142904.1 hypothetical protein [Chryseobacterium sp. CFS15]